MSAISDFLSAVELGAGSVYHQVVQAVPKVTQWSANHPELQPLLRGAESFATSLLGDSSAGAAVPVSEAMLAALKLLAARDATVQSGH